MRTQRERGNASFARKRDALRGSRVDDYRLREVGPNPGIRRESEDTVLNSDAEKSKASPEFRPEFRSLQSAKRNTGERPLWLLVRKSRHDPM